MMTSYYRFPYVLVVRSSGRSVDRRYKTEAAARKAAPTLDGSRITLFHEPTKTGGGHFLGHLR